MFESDEFETEFGLWELIKESGNLKENYSYQNGELYLKFTNDGNDFLGHLRQLDYQVNFESELKINFNQKASNHRDIDLPLFGYYEASIDVDSIRNGRSCQFYLVPQNFNLNPNGDDETDTTARKGSNFEQY